MLGRVGAGLALEPGDGLAQRGDEVGVDRNLAAGDLPGTVRGDRPRGAGPAVARTDDDDAGRHPDPGEGLADDVAAVLPTGVRQHDCAVRLALGREPQVLAQLAPHPVGVARVEAAGDGGRPALEAELDGELQRRTGHHACLGTP